jgi:glycosyltransferase involved in cell wall biosynthesis
MTYRIAVDGRPFAGYPNGYSTYTGSIVDILCRRGFSVTLLTDRALGDFEQIRDLPVTVLPGESGWGWEQGLLRRHLREANYDVYFAGSNRGLPLRPVGRTRLVLGLLDLIPLRLPHLYLFRSRGLYLRREFLPLLASGLRADAILTISRASARDIKRLFPHKPVTPIWIHLPKPATAKRRRAKQFVYVGGNDPRKRIDNLFKGFALFSASHDDYRLTLIGGGYDVLDPLAAKLNISGAIDKRGYVDRPTRDDLVAHSTAVVYPSLYEGFGLAIAEALLAGAPVVAGRGGAQEEIGGDAVVYADPRRPEELARAMTVVTEPAERQRLDESIMSQAMKLASPTIEEETARFFSRQAEQARVRRA